MLHCIPYLYSFESKFFFSFLQVGSALGLALGALMPSVDAALEAGKMLTMMGIIFGG